MTRATRAQRRLLAPRLSAFASCLVLFGALARVEAIDTIEPDAALQKRILAVTRAQSEPQLQQALASLREAEGKEDDRLIPQLVWALMNAKDEHEAMIVGVIVQRLDLSPAQLRRSLAPYANTKDPALRRQLDNILGSSSPPPTPGS